MELQFPRQEEGEGVDPAKGNKNTTNYRNFEVKADIRYQNEVRIYNMSANPTQYITLQNRPPELDFRGETTWATIKSMGRNTPMYHFTGAEDIIQFNVSWFSTTLDNPEEVINKCRLLEAWTKANGYQAAPPIIQIEWGDSGIFENHYYILTSATYTLKNFQNGYRIRVPGKPATFGNGKLLPAAATQELIFKRVSAYNLSYGDLLILIHLRRRRALNMIDTSQYLKGASPYDQAYVLNYGDGDYSLEAVRTSVPSSSDDIQHTVKDGETLQNIAYRYYGDSGKWFLIAEANTILNPFKELESGTLIKIPVYAG